MTEIKPYKKHSVLLKDITQLTKFAIPTYSLLNFFQISYIFINRFLSNFLACSIRNTQHISRLANSKQFFLKSQNLEISYITEDLELG